MKKIFILTMLLLPATVNATVMYRVSKSGSPEDSETQKNEFANKHRFYIGGAYNFAMWQDFSSDKVSLNGKNSSGFEVMAGARLYDTFRLEANYLNTAAKWNQGEIRTNSVFINALFDARIDNIYRFFYGQVLVPYVGAGAGVTWLSPDDDITANDTSVSLAALAGLAFEFGERFALDIGYRYMYTFKPDISAAPDLAPQSHQLRAGLRMNF